MLVPPASSHLTHATPHPSLACPRSLLPTARRHEPGTLTDVTRPVNVLLGGGVTWGLDLSAEEGGPTLASIALEAEANLGISTVGGSKEVIITANARGPTLTIADVIELDFSGMLDLGQNIQFRYKSKSDFFFQYVLYASANNDISGLLQDAPGLSDLLTNIVTFEGSVSLAVQVDAIGAAVRIEVDGSFSIADDIASQFDIPSAGGKVSILLTKKHKESDFRVTLVINGKAYCVGVYNRGSGHGVDTCPTGTVKDPNGLLCYPTCRAGYYLVGPVCWQYCPSGYTITGAHCLKPAAYGRGGGYPWKFGDGLSLDAAKRRCEKTNPGGCEKNGEIYYVSPCAMGDLCGWVGGQGRGWPGGRAVGRKGGYVLEPGLGKGIPQVGRLLP